MSTFPSSEAAEDAEEEAVEAAALLYPDMPYIDIMPKEDIMDAEVSIEEAEAEEALSAASSPSS